MQKKAKKFSKFANNQFDFILCITVLLLLALGIIMVLSASAPSSLATTGNSYTYVKKQLVFAIVGLFVMFFLSKVDYRFYKKYYWYIYFASWLVLLLVVVPGLGYSVKGATRWIKIGGSQFQPSEITKIGMIIFYGGYLADHKSELQSLVRGYIVPLLYLAPPVLILYVVQNHFSVSLVVGVVVLVMMFMAGTRLKYFLVTGIIAVAGVSLLIGFAGLKESGKNDSDSFRLDRIATYFDPWADAQGTGYQTVQSLYAIGSGGMFGLGLGNSKQKYLYIPEPHNDFIFSILAEELGYFGCIIVIGLFAILIWRGILISMRAQDVFGSIIAIGITTLIAVQTIINIAVVTGTVPTTGMSLPFFSYGGTALLLLLANVGILLNISRFNSKV
ncbi:MAG: putative lipid II flippase FtsW [Clostridia bacterium]|nr:putative lipid II flippase FtsW [Clostridia bacterium]